MSISINLFAEQHPIGHDIARDGDYLICRDCEVRVYAPPSKPILTPMQQSLSRFD
jgi:hypothetical protein